MSLIHLSSIGQRPYDFTNIFPQGINLGKHAEICLVGYSGIMKGDEGIDLREDDVAYIIQKGTNDGLVFQHANPSAALDEQQYCPISISVAKEIGQSGLELDADELATELEDALNNQDPNTSVAWTVAWNVSPALNYTIKCDMKRFPVGDNENGGEWVQYPPSPTPTQGTIVNAGANCTISPTVGGGAFLDTRPVFFGDCGQAPASLLGQGYTVEFDTVLTTTLEDVQLTYGVSSPDFITMFDRLGKIENMGYGQRPPIGDIDFAYPRNSGAYVQYGFDIDVLTGEVFTIECATRSPINADGLPVIGEYKSAAGQVVRTATGLSITPLAANTVRLNISPRYVSTGVGTGHYVMVFSVDTGGGAYVVVHTARVGSYLFHSRNCPYWSKTAALNPVLCYDQQYISASSVTARLKSLAADDAQSGAAAGGGDSLSGIGIGFRPLENVFAISAAPAPASVAPLKTESNSGANHLGLGMGFIEPYQFLVATSATGWTSEQKPTEVVTDLQTPFLITCPDLPVRGYVGAGTGGGAESQLIGVGRIRNLTTGNAFSNEPTPVWLKLNNEYNVRLDRLNIVLRDEQNKVYKRLLPDFSLWIQFRCPKKVAYIGKERDVSVGATYTHYGGNMTSQGDKQSGYLDFPE